ncbi:MAG TPA: carbohydrate ABC transporter permease [Acidimicrobiales bacterium]|nr:carbohydrate ABC transporter permease [Acidimicrobiales bacterium]
MTGAVMSGVRGANHKKKRARWLRLVVAVVFAAIVLVPIGVIALNSFLPPAAFVSGGLSLVHGFTLADYHYVIGQTTALLYLRNSLIVAVTTAVLTILIGAPGAYALARGAGRDLAAYSLSLFLYQALPVVVFVIPLFLLFVPLHLDNTLQGLVIVYTAGSLPFAIWMLKANFEAIPFAIEEAARIDGCSLLGAFRRVVLPNAGSGLLSVAMFSFLVAWNDYLVADVMLRTNSVFTLPIGLETFFQQYSTEWGAVMAMAMFMLAPPVLLFVAASRYFSVGGIGGAVVG